MAVGWTWLKMELSTLMRQCLNRRIPDRPTLEQEVAAWEQSHDTAEVSVDWRFTTQNARTKLKRLYPSIQD